jgi:ABC-type glycerol-3-phosphate transport system substrate-binding protein
MAGTLLSGCGAHPFLAILSPDASSGSSSSAAPKEKVKISYWHHDGAAKTTDLRRDVCRLHEGNPNRGNYLGLPADSFFQKYLTAVATNSGPDTYGKRQGELSAMVAQKP